MLPKIRFIGRICYEDSVNLQNEERLLFLNGESSGTIFFLEHYPVITIGRNGSSDNLLKSAEYLNSQGIDVKTSSRGGDITAHEPGQLVVYFVMPVKSKNAKKFVNGITGKIISFLEKDYGIKSSYDKKNPGIWVDEAKICSIGFDLTGGVSMHGIALNVCNSLETFQYIVPCGISGCSMTTMEKVTGKKTEIEEVYERLREYFEH
jgi:lipoate-protein ligase B